MHGGATGRFRNSSTGAALAVLLGLAFLPDWPGRGLADGSYDLPFRLRPDRETDGAAIVFIDETSARELSLPWGEETWDRAIYARLIHRLVAGGARVIVFDVLFDRPGTNDAPLCDAIRAATNAGVKVLLAAKADSSAQAGKFQGHSVVAPFPALQQLAPWGLAENGDNRATRRVHFAGDRDLALPSLAWLATGRPAPQDGEAGTTRWINYYGPAGGIRHRRLHEVLNTNLDLSAVFSNQVCFIGGKADTPPAAGTRVDEWRTPYSGRRGDRMSGVETIATVYLNLMRGDWLARLPGFSEALVIVLAGAALGFGLPRFRPGMAVLAGALAALLAVVAACALAWERQVWFSWLIIAAVQAPAAVAWAALAYTRRLARERTLVEERLAAAQTTSSIGTELVSSDSPTRRDSSSATSAAGSPAVTIPARPSAPSGLPALESRPAVPDHELLRRVGQGAYGEVWLARNAIGTFHAVKLVRRETFEQAGPFEREFRGLQKFMPISREHPGLVQILHVGRSDRDGLFYYVMEAADDETTQQQINPDAYTPKNLAREIKRRGHLPVTECLSLALDLAAALEFLHQHGLIHRDIKPANIIFVRGVPKLADIGLVTEVATTGHEVSLLGTRDYIPPEGPGSPAADVFGLGKVLYAASMGLPAGSFPELPADLPQRPDAAALFQFNQLLLNACHETVASRYLTATALREALLELQRQLRQED